MNREVLTTSGTYPWSFVTQIFHSGQPNHGGDHNIFEVMTSTSQKWTLGSVASLLAATLYQGNPDRNRKLWNIVSSLSLSPMRNWRYSWVVNAIKTNFPSSQHILCTRHLKENTQIHFFKPQCHGSNWIRKQFFNIRIIYSGSRISY